ncbi:HD domain-containing protein [Pseudenhygromyxa sp. WMMC2535]|uniref:HD domain-containing protein n=1 Tax=Pseudenhygromyxa sp. WMMC2535 TaxID=2712867 RepID=UPI001554CC27|nr:HD domain-containing protein [Pseudenhygromyxa sp. WMMC2535]NVB38396.1 HD domain-containing protein [Pseudenhygromyxa sp. WMMC2535]
MRVSPVSGARAGSAGSCYRLADAGMKGGVDRENSELEDLLAPVIAAGRQAELPSPAQVERVAARAPRILDCPPAQLHARLTEALCARHPHLALQALHELGLLAQLLPELEATVNFSQESQRRHKDVWEHTKTVVWQSVPRPAVRWAAVLHDIGKVPTRCFLDDGRVSFHGHAEVGERMFIHGPAARLGFPPALRQRVAVLIRMHLRPGQYEDSWTDAALRRFYTQAGEGLRDLLDLSRADITSKRPGQRKRCLLRISTLSRRVQALIEADAQVDPLPSGLGHVLIAELGLSPGPVLGRLRRRLEALCEAGELEAGREPSYYVERSRDLGLVGQG